MFDDTELHLFMLCLIIGVVLGIMLGIGKSHGAENPNPYKPMGSSTSQEIKIKKQMFNACISSGENRARCYRIYYGN